MTTNNERPVTAKAEQATAYAAAIIEFIINF